MYIGDNMKIEKIKKMKNGKYKLKFDNGKELATYDNVILENNLLFHKEVDSVEQLLKDTDYYDLYYKMVKKISTKLRSTYEIEEFLKKEQVETSKKDEIIQKLKNNGLLNDLTFAKAYVSDKVYLSMEGPYLIRKGLEEHHLENSIIEEAMNTIDEEEIQKKLTKYIQKKIQGNHKYSNYLFKQKITNECVNKGYSIDMIQRIFDESKTDSDDVIKKEGEHIIRKLSKKYEEEDLKRKVKEKLYQKGFSISDINQFFEKRGW